MNGTVEMALVAGGLELTAQTTQKAAQQKAPPARPALARSAAGQAELPDNPVADPKAVVTIGHARFTVLTPQLIRMEWSADGKFEDHASMVFINRRLPVPHFTVGPQLILPSRHPARFTPRTEINWGALQIRYAPANDNGGFTALSLSIVSDGIEPAIVMAPQGWPIPVICRAPHGSLDQARGSKTQQPIEPGLVSRAERLLLCELWLERS